jgi:hypothetical protein
MAGAVRGFALRFAVTSLLLWGLLFWLADLALQIAMVRPFLMDDAESYAVAGRHLLASQPIYAAFQLAGPFGMGDAAWGRGFIYPPTAALLFAPLAPFGQHGLAALFLAAWGLFGLLSYRVARSIGLEVRFAAVVALVVTVSGPAINATSSGNINLLIAAALLASWLWPRSSGYLAVMGGLIKLYPAAGLVWALRKGDPFWRPVAVGVFAVAATTALLGVGVWHDFLVAFANGRSTSWYFVPSPSQLIGPGLGTLLGYGLAGLALVGVWRIRDDRLAFALLGWAMILPAPDWWSHYLLIPLAAGLPWLCAALYPSVARAMSPKHAGSAVPARLRP